jgi:hypothetical protein
MPPPVPQDFHHIIVIVMVVGPVVHPAIRILKALAAEGGVDDLRTMIYVSPTVGNDMESKTEVCTFV